MVKLSEITSVDDIESQIDEIICYLQASDFFGEVGENTFINFYNGMILAIDYWSDEHFTLQMGSEVIGCNNEQDTSLALALLKSYIAFIKKQVRKQLPLELKPQGAV